MIWIGIAGLALAAMCAYLARAAHARARSMESAETLPVRDLRSLHEAAAQAAGPGNFRYRCEVAGHARPHRDGALRSELEELECVWHRHKISRKYEEIYRDGNGNRKRRTRTDVLSEHSSSTAFFVADATGKVAVHPAGHEVVGAEKVLDRFDPVAAGANRLELGPLSLNLGGGDGTLGYLREEWLVRPGSRFYVHGEATDAAGHLAIVPPDEGGAFVLSVKSERELLRGENHKVLAYGLGSGLAAVVGAALIVIGAVR